MLRIVKDNAKSLHSPSKPVEVPVSKEDQSLLLEMYQYLLLTQDEKYREANPKVREGVGLAAPQVGVNKQMCVVAYQEGETTVKHLMINPHIVVSSIKKCYLQSGEGCLSVDKDHPGYIVRDYRIEVDYIDGETLEKKHVKAIGFEAIVMQHEIDHLKGILFYDHIDKKNPYGHPDSAVAI